jgi:hypothetical protein
MNLNIQTAIEFAIGLIGIVTAAAGFASWLTSLSIRHQIIEQIAQFSANSVTFKHDLVNLRRRVKLIEQFAVKRGFIPTNQTKEEDTNSDF